jgi:hypothetical protein
VRFWEKKKLGKAWSEQMPFEILENCRIDIEKFNYEEPK